MCTNSTHSKYFLKKANNLLINRITRNALNHMKDDMRKNLPLLGFEDYEDQVEICQGKTERFNWYKKFVCPLPVCFITILIFYKICLSFLTVITASQQALRVMMTSPQKMSLSIRLLIEIWIHPLLKSKKSK